MPKQVHPYYGLKKIQPTQEGLLCEVQICGSTPSIIKPLSEPLNDPKFYFHWKIIFPWKK